MKKTLSLLLALVMIFSCFSAMSAAAEDGDLVGNISNMIYNEETINASREALGHLEIKNLPDQITDFDTFKGSAEWDKVSLMGIDLDFLYSATGILMWSELDVFLEENGKLVYGTDGLPVQLVTKDDISLAFTNISIYLQRVLYNQYGGLNLYSVENAVAMANFVGKIFYPDFMELDANNYKNYFTNEVPSANEFFRAVTTLSGLDKLIDYNWITRGKAYCEPIVTILGGDYITFLDEYYNDGLTLGSKILEAMVKKLIAVGPVDFVYDLINIFSSSSYDFVYRDPTLALLTHKVSSFGGYMSEDELYSFNGLLKLIFCDGECYSSAVSGTGFCPFEFPIERFNNAADKTEQLIYFYYYLNLCGRYRNNTYYFENVKRAIESSAALSSDDKIKLVALIDGFLLGKIDNAIENAIVPLYKENITTASVSLGERIKNAFMTFLKKIADYFDYLRKIFSGELNYGEGNSPFN